MNKPWLVQTCTKPHKEGAARASVALHTCPARFDLVTSARAQVNVASFKKGQLQVKAHAWDRNLGGRDFDEALFDYWVSKFDAQYKVDIRTSPRASFRLRLACEKVRMPSSALRALESPLTSWGVAAAMTHPGCVGSAFVHGGS